MFSSIASGRFSFTPPTPDIMNEEPSPPRTGVMIYDEADRALDQPNPALGQVDGAAVQINLPGGEANRPVSRYDVVGCILSALQKIIGTFVFFGLIRTDFFFFVMLGAYIHSALPFLFLK